MTFLFSACYSFIILVIICIIFACLLYIHIPGMRPAAGSTANLAPYACTSNACHRDIITRNELWQVVHNPLIKEEEIAIFGAYLDDRPNIGENKTIRVFTASTVTKHTRIFCQLWYFHLSSPIVVVSEAAKLGRGLTYKGHQYYEWLYSCPLPQMSSIPTNVSLAFSKNDKSTTLVEIIVPEREEVHEFGVCVAVSYGKLDPYHLVEWIELNRILGVGEFNLYDSHLNQEAIKVLQYYSDLGVVKLHKSTPAVDNWCHWCQKLTVISAFNDCLYRNMYRYKYTLVIDVDEFIIPHKQPNLHRMLEMLTKKNKEQPGFIFRNAYFFMDFDPSGTNEEYVITTRYLTRLHPSKQGYAPKSIVNPRHCVVVLNHYCLQRTPDVGKQWTVVVDPDSALLHHYKKCHFTRDVCQNQMRNSVYDGTVLRYKAPLLAQVQSHLAALKKQNLIV